jgi:hypothetical protein
MEKALAYRKLTPTAFPAPSLPYASPATVVLRSNRLERDNGQCKGTNAVELFSDASVPTADCKPNEVEVPDVRGTLLAQAKARLLQQPLLARVEWTSVKPGERLGVVVRQTPTAGTLSAYGRVTLFVARGNARLKNGEPARP